MPVESDDASERGAGSHSQVPPAGGGEPEPQRDGVLSVERHRKADGRTLLLYSWVDADG
jgi:hypothetical protein